MFKVNGVNVESLIYREKLPVTFCTSNLGTFCTLIYKIIISSLLQLTLQWNKIMINCEYNQQVAAAALVYE